MQFSGLKQQYSLIKSKVDKRIADVHEHGQYISGPEVSELEARLKNYCKVNHAVTCGNGTDALEIALKSLDVGVGHAVFCPTFSFFATAESIVNCGATPIFVDIEMDTMNISIPDLKKVIEETTKKKKLVPKAIISVDLFGAPSDAEAIRNIADEYELNFIIDGAQSFGATINGSCSYSLAHISTTSFFPAKPLGCYGDGGALFSNSKPISEKAISLREHGKTNDNKYLNSLIGRNSRLDTIQAAVLLEKLHIFDSELKRRNEIAHYYHENLSKNFRAQILIKNSNSAWAQFTLQHNERDSICRYLFEKNIPTAVYYNKCIHMQPCMKKYNSRPNRLQNAESSSQNCFSIPSHAYLSDDDLEYICYHLNKFS